MSLNSNVLAFLAMLRHSEGSDKAPDPYRVVFGFGHTIVDLSDHPASTGEWMGVSIAFLGPQYMGKISTAAGAYQITRPTWRPLKMLLALPDFTGPSQDAAAVELIHQKGALGLVMNGQVADAINLCHPIWASLPGSTANQPITSFADLMTAYHSAGGGFA